jgi:hypothetical protein
MAVINPPEKKLAKHTFVLGIGDDGTYQNN